MGEEGIVTVEPSTSGEDSLTIVTDMSAKRVNHPIFKKILGPKTVYENARFGFKNKHQSFDELCQLLRFPARKKRWLYSLEI